MFKATTSSLNSKNKSSDRILVLGPKEGENVTNSKGLIDNRLFSGGNVLHAIMDTSNCIWSLKYEKGALPPALDQKFTTFTKLLDYTKQYLDRRGVEIVEIKD